MTDQKNQGAAIPTPQGAAGRLFRMIVQGNALRLVFVLIAIVISAVASVGASVFLESLIDDYIKPLLLMENPVFDESGAEIIVALKACAMWSTVCGRPYRDLSLQPHHGHGLAAHPEEHP